jgi:hypothetical protein
LIRVATPPRRRGIDPGLIFHNSFSVYDSPSKLVA